MTRVFASLFALAVAIEGGLLTIVRARGLREHLLLTISLLVALNIFYITAVWLVTRTSTSSSSVAILICGAAVVFRLTVLPLEPTLSYDVYRYRWEGKLQEHGGNPYNSRPADPDLSYLRDETYDKIPGHDFKTVYGPVIESMHLGTYKLVSSHTPDPARQVFWFKLPGALFDLATIAALMWLLSRRDLPSERVLAYAWSPLIVIEFAGTGHHDSLVLFLIATALALATSARWWSVFTVLSIAAAAKIWPLALFPAFVGWTGRYLLRPWQPLMLLPVAAVTAIPYWTNVMENAQFLSGFLGGWRNNDSLYGQILALTGDVYRAKYTAFALLGVFIAWTMLRRWPLDRAVLGTIVVMLAVSANCHPWYLTWFVPLLCLMPAPALLLWTALVPLAYETLFAWFAVGVWNGVSDTRWLIYVPVISVAIVSWLLRRGGKTE